MIYSNPLPDIAEHQVAAIPGRLDWVGMENICIPLKVDVPGTKPQVVNCNTNIYVSLENSAAKGIHMSRLHLKLNQMAGKELNPTEIDTLLKGMIESQTDLSLNARAVFQFDLFLEKPALSGKEFGFQSYPLMITAERMNDFSRYQMDITIPYSSTCPCSASLARQLMSQRVMERFTDSKIDREELAHWLQSEEGSVATPHSQRSYAYIHLEFDPKDWPDFCGLIHRFEKIISTPVQTVVKREDEQAFARINAENLMFCEDTARRIKMDLEKFQYLTNYRIKVEHQESLHDHNAVVLEQKYPR